MTTRACNHDVAVLQVKQLEEAQRQLAQDAEAQVEAAARFTALAGASLCFLCAFSSHAHLACS
jgi:hypothetical protein